MHPYVQYTHIYICHIYIYAHSYIYLYIIYTYIPGVNVNPTTKHGRFMGVLPPSGGGDPRSEFEGCLTHLLAYQAGRTWQAPGGRCKWRVGNSKKVEEFMGSLTHKNEPLFCRWVVFIHIFVCFLWMLLFCFAVVFSGMDEYELNIWYGLNMSWKPGTLTFSSFHSLKLHHLNLNRIDDTSRFSLKAINFCEAVGGGFPPGSEF